MDRRQCIFCISNISPQVQPLALSDVNLTDTERWVDLLGGIEFESINQVAQLQPYQSVWLSNAPGYGLVPGGG